MRLILCMETCLVFSHVWEDDLVWNWLGIMSFLGVYISSGIDLTVQHYKNDINKNDLLLNDLATFH